MEVANLALEYLRVLAWPILLGAILWLNRKRLAGLMDRVIGAEIPGVGRVDFQPPPQDQQPQPPADIPQPEELETARRQVKDLEKSYEELSRNYSRLHKWYTYEAIWSQLHKSQVELLQYSSAQPNRTMPYQNGVRFYQKGTFIHGPKQEPYQHYIDFLAQAELITLLPGSTGVAFLQVTDKGIEFLQYLTARGLTPQMKPGR